MAALKVIAMLALAAAPVTSQIETVQFGYSDMDVRYGTWYDECSWDPWLKELGLDVYSTDATGQQQSYWDPERLKEYTRELCEKLCPDRIDVSPDFMPGPTVGQVMDYSVAANQGVCIIATEVFTSTIVTTKFPDCVFICRARSNKIDLLDDSDLLYMKQGVNNYAVGGTGDDVMYTEGHMNHFQGNDNQDVLMVRGNMNKLHGDHHDDILVAVGRDNEASGGTSNDVVVGFGSSNVLKGDKGKDTVVGFGGAGNFVSGGASAPDTCVGCAGGAVCDATCEVMI